MRKAKKLVRLWISFLWVRPFIIPLLRRTEYRYLYLFSFDVYRRNVHVGENRTSLCWYVLIPWHQIIVELFVGLGDIYNIYNCTLCVICVMWGVSVLSKTWRPCSRMITLGLLNFVRANHFAVRERQYLSI